MDQIDDFSKRVDMGHIRGDIAIQSTGLGNSILYSPIHKPEEPPIIESSESPYLKERVRSPQQEKEDMMAETISCAKAIQITLRGKGPIEIGEGVYMQKMGSEYLAMRQEEIIIFSIRTPDDRIKHFKGPVYAFRGCRTAEDFALRALEHEET